MLNFCCVNIENNNNIILSPLHDYGSITGASKFGQEISPPPCILLTLILMYGYLVAKSMNLETRSAIKINQLPLILALYTASK